MSLFKIIIFGILMTNFGVQGQQETSLSIPEGVPYAGTVFDQQKLGTAIVSKMHSIQTVYDIAFEQHPTFKSIFVATFTAETNEGLTFIGIRCLAAVYLF